MHTTTTTTNTTNTTTCEPARARNRYGKKNPLLSMSAHTKFFLLRTLCSDGLQVSTM